MASTLLTTGIIMGVLLLIIFLFKWFHTKGRATKNAKQTELITGVISDKKLDITEKEFINNYFLGIDKLNFLLLYLNLNERDGKPVLLDLWQIKTTKIQTEDKNIYGERKENPVLEDKKVTKLKIQVFFMDGGVCEDIVLYEYSNAVEDFVHIKKRAEKWCHLINKTTEAIQDAIAQKSKYA